MQKIKDSFYMEMRSRLQLKFPLRTMLVLYQQRPAIAVAENEAGTAQMESPGAFWIHWGEAAENAPTAGWMRMECLIRYSAAGSDDANGQDAGRKLAKMDEELIAILEPRRCAVKDHAVTPAAEEGFTFCWQSARFAAPEKIRGMLVREVRFDLNFSNEGALA